jgi:hypothetical protein
MSVEECMLLCLGCDTGPHLTTVVLASITIQLTFGSLTAVRRVGYLEVGDLLIPNGSYPLN